MTKKYTSKKFHIETLESLEISKEFDKFCIKLNDNNFKLATNPRLYIDYAGCGLLRLNLFFYISVTINKKFFPAIRQCNFVDLIQFVKTQNTVESMNIPVSHTLQFPECYRMYKTRQTPSLACWVDFWELFC